ncbi:hypothetical protein P167DRAFT_377882 [Morchella conica CCBAS932]|uniref:Uncharacterized protein n=1 Tax=Morchella conica CCBAS932 TaxID=1392247 RepID=A0A3N4KZ07_9PEZI|nr:hypothetical protein P167DRAFT_377882 [Morchella conica CCBAS932]
MYMYFSNPSEPWNQNSKYTLVEYLSSAWTSLRLVAFVYAAFIFQKSDLKRTFRSAGGVPGSFDDGRKPSVAEPYPREKRFSCRAFIYPFHSPVVGTWRSSKIFLLLPNQMHEQTAACRVCS